MTPNQALQKIRALAQGNRVRFTVHALQRAYERGASMPHATHALSNATNIRPTPNQSSDWKVKGPDLDGDDLTLAVALEEEVIVITMY